MSLGTGLYGEFAPRGHAPKVNHRPLWHQLVVIGNGFDLECGLNSGFASFMAARKSAFDAVDDVDDAGPLHFRRTIWDVILGSLGDSSWCDVEGAISAWLIGGCLPGEAEGRFGSLMDEVLDALARLGKDWDDRGGCLDAHPVGSVAYYLAGSSEEAGAWAREKLFELTKADLGYFERDFAVYLRDELSKNDEYPRRAAHLMADLLCDGRAGKGEYHIEESVLSFNYTSAGDSLESLGKQVPWINIHGALDAGDEGCGEIVFGIDGTGLLDDDDALPFTKTYRILGLGTAADGKLVHAPSAVGNRDCCTALIKFYGHSLSHVDYSYFQSIFDSVRLYESHTKLIFYYRRHSKGEISEGEKEKELAEIRIDTMRRVIKLMSAYAETLENKDHGRNLIHKLLIEGRLVVMELPCGAPVQIVAR